MIFFFIFTIFAIQSTNQGQQKGGNHQNAYEKVVYNAASNFLSQQAQGSGGKRSEKPTFKLGNQKPSWGKTNAPAKPQQLHYCEVCKISCAGPQVYNIYTFLIKYPNSK